MKLYFVIDGEPTEEDIKTLEEVKLIAIEKGLVVEEGFIGGHPRRH